MNHRLIGCCVVIADFRSSHVPILQAVDSPQNQLNILLIVADVVDYSDLGCFGGATRTLTIVALAARGLRATIFFVDPSCSPARSMPFAIPVDWSDRSKVKYNRGYDVIRKERLEHQKILGIVNADAATFPRLPNIPARESTSERA